MLPLAALLALFVALAVRGTDEEWLDDQVLGFCRHGAQRVVHAFDVGAVAAGLPDPGDEWHDDGSIGLAGGGRMRARHRNGRTLAAPAADTSDERLYHGKVAAPVCGDGAERLVDTV